MNSIGEMIAEYLVKQFILAVIICTTVLLFLIEGGIYLFKHMSFHWI